MGTVSLRLNRSPLIMKRHPGGEAGKRRRDAGQSRDTSDRSAAMVLGDVKAFTEICWAAPELKKRKMLLSVF
ncbi:hypothetical protein PO124_16585 [Bacillus licheniformis]|nr:hypothetical protein [Bacillus licheniformis]